MLLYHFVTNNLIALLEALFTLILLDLRSQCSLLIQIIRNFECLLRLTIVNGNVSPTKLFNFKDKGRILDVCQGRSVMPVRGVLYFNGFSRGACMRLIRSTMILP